MEMIMQMKDVKATSWVYVLVQTSEGHEQIVGQRDSANDIAFVPTFLDKDSAQQGVVQLAKEKGKKFEIQAILLEDLERYAAQSKFLLFFLDADGRIIEKRAPLS